MKKGVLRIFSKFTGKHLCQSLFFNKVAGLNKETLAQVFFSELCEIFQNTYFCRTPPVAASVHLKTALLSKQTINVLKDC